MTEPIIRARGLEKRFGDVAAVRGVDLDVPPGTCLGLLGPNGAGKTTTMRMLMGLTRPTAGTLTVFGRPLADADRAQRRRVGLVPQDNNLDPDLTVVENLEVYGRYFGLPADTVRERVGRLLAFMQLAEKAKAKVNQLSGGMKRRLVIARALIAEPDLVILDEPTTGLDPQARVLIWKQLGGLKAAGKTLLLTTHYMDEAQRLCDRIVLIDGGRILDQGTPDELIGRHVLGHVVEVRHPVPAALLADGLAHEDIGDAVLFYVADPAHVIGRLPGEAEFLHRPANLEDVFLRLAGRQLRER
ncbi:MAG: ATP-binding cassette domain-containing protein [Geminicoccaceae bacterium]